MLRTFCAVFVQAWSRPGRPGFFYLTVTSVI